MELYITTGLIMLASLSGLIFLIKSFESWLHRNSKYIIAFSAGIFAVVTFNLSIETFEFNQHLSFAILAIVGGFLIFEIIEKIFPEIHHHDSEHQSVCSHSKLKVIWGDALHNIGDGILLTLAFSVDVQVGLVAALGIFIHEFVQEVTEFSVLRLSGLSAKKALFINFLVSATIIPGVLIGTYLTQIDYLIGILFGLAAGAFLHLIFTDLVPHSIENSKKDKRFFAYIFLVIAGIFTILAVNQIGGGHSHDMEHDEHSHNQDVHHDEDHIE